MLFHNEYVDVADYLLRFNNLKCKKKTAQIAVR